MNHLLYGAALAAATRVMSGEVQIDGRARCALESAADAMEDVHRTVDGLSIERPGTWFRFARRLLQRSLNEPDIEWTQQWLEQEGYTREEDRLPSLWLELCSRAPRTIAYRQDREVVWRYQVGEEHFFITMAVGKSLQTSGSRWSRVCPEVRLPGDRTRYRRVQRAIARFFWQERTSLLLDYVNDDVHFVDSDDDGPGYVGPMTSQFETWARYREEGIRRCVLLQGTPGTGKSTFAREAARRLSSRTVFMTSAAANDISASDWQLMLEMLEPEMVVIDDVDRLSESTLEGNLRMFEEHHCKVPFIIFTSNDHAQLPRPMRRPGRIDQILKMDEPEAEVLEYVIVELAKREGVEIPPERLPELVTLAQETSTAHVVELLRRARVEGWNRAPLECDITFGDGFVEQTRDDDLRRLDRLDLEREAISRARISPAARESLLADLPFD